MAENLSETKPNTQYKLNFEFQIIGNSLEKAI